MQKYIRCHIVKATPMTREAYNNLRGLETPDENPDAEGYHVVYPDGYESWCPKAQFEAAGRPVDGMTFGQAIDACRHFGKKIQRANWNGEGQFVRYEEVLASEDGKLHDNPQDAPGMAAPAALCSTSRTARRARLASRSAGLPRRPTWVRATGASWRTNLVALDALGVSGASRVCCRKIITTKTPFLFKSHPSSQSHNFTNA